MVTLLPLSIEELDAAGIELSRDDYILRGFLPAIYDRNQNPVDAYEAYYRTYVERDVRQLVNITHQGEFELFLRLYFLRDKSGTEVDLAVERNRKLSFIEIKSAKTPDDGMAKNIRSFRRTTGQGEHAHVIYAGEDWPLKDCDGFVNFKRTCSTVN